MFSLANKVALVTGGASGIGLEVARRFKQAGAAVAIGDLADRDGVAESEGFFFVKMDVASSSSVEAGILAVAENLGKLDILVNNAGIGGEDGVTIEDSDEQLTRRLFEINAMALAQNWLLSKMNL